MLLFEKENGALKPQHIKKNMHIIQSCRDRGAFYKLYGNNEVNNRDIKVGKCAVKVILVIQLRKFVSFYTRKS